MKNYNYLFKYIIVGSTSVGKSCLLLQYVDQKFRDAHQITMGVEFGTNIIKYNSHIIKLHIWDTAGQESYQSMIRAYYRNAIGCILVFDLTDRKSFESLIRWHNEVLACSGNDIQIIIVGNKHDLQNKYTLLYSKIEEKFKKKKHQNLQNNLMQIIQKLLLQMVQMLFRYLKILLHRYFKKFKVVKLIHKMKFMEQKQEILKKEEIHLQFIKLKDLLFK
ncbi:unnamed protein product [Paramecium primaurelia]|uniref:Uncharacterized protein n=1 Tax=Paramecium primaurelia TaxID=5886 RepID=A0A8S1Q1G7_PARPR|nr:unnamed protein product [Paramecium primaurelia]